MPIYIYKHPEKEEYIELVQSMKDEHIYTDNNGLKWDRVWLNPQLNTDSNIDPFDNNHFVNKTGDMKCTYGDMLDYSKELSEKRKSMNNGVDPVQQKYFKEYSNKRKGAKHVSEKKQKSFENKNFKITYD
jgi:hypothetical protein